MALLETASPYALLKSNSPVTYDFGRFILAGLAMTPVFKALWVARPFVCVCGGNPAMESIKRRGCKSKLSTLLH